jgi:hypothetical protein
VTSLQPGPTDTEFFERAGMEDTKVAEASKDDPAEVARHGFEALMAGKDHVIAGSGKNKAQVAGTSCYPRPKPACTPSRPVPDPTSSPESRSSSARPSSIAPRRRAGSDQR